jgi:hypothetical protein
MKLTVSFQLKGLGYNSSVFSPLALLSSFPAQRSARSSKRCRRNKLIEVIADDAAASRNDPAAQ